MKVFFICNKSPYPHREGGPIAMNRLIEGMLRRGHQVKVLAINSDKYHVNIEDVPPEYRKKTNLELHYIDLTVKPVDALFNLFTSKSYHVQRFISASFRRRIAEILREEDFDIIQFETLYIAPYIDTIRSITSAPIILRAHNIEHKIWQRVRDITRNPFKKLYLNHLAKTLENYETGILPDFDGIVPITRKDANYFEKYNAHVIDVPFGIYPDEYTVSAPSRWEYPSLFHIGSMNWMPNEEGIRWFLERVWPVIHLNHPNVPLYLAGRHMPPWLTNLNRDGVHVLGEVDSAADFIGEKGVMIVPLLSGSGIRIKIIEGMAAGKPIVSTSIGAEGITCSPGEDIMLGDSPEAFADAVSALLKDKQKAVRMGQKARQLIEQKYDNDAIAHQLEHFFEKIIADKRL